MEHTIGVVALCAGIPAVSSAFSCSVSSCPATKWYSFLKTQSLLPHFHPLLLLLQEDPHKAGPNLPGLIGRSLTLPCLILQCFLKGDLRVPQEFTRSLLLLNLLMYSLSHSFTNSKDFSETSHMLSGRDKRTKMTLVKGSSDLKSDYRFF